MKIGEQIERLRRLKKITLTQLAKESGVQIATLSRIENGKMTGTVESHLRIAQALNVDITELYQNLQQEDPVADGDGERLAPITDTDNRWSREILAHQAASKKMLPAILKIEVGGETPHEAKPGGTEQFIYILEGTVEVRLRDQIVTLEPRMSLYFSAVQPHSIANTGSTVARVLSVSTPVRL